MRFLVIHVKTVMSDTGGSWRLRGCIFIASEKGSDRAPGLKGNRFQQSGEWDGTRSDRGGNQSDRSLVTLFK